MIKEILITVLTSSGIIGIATKFLIDRLKAYESRQKALELGVQALLRDRLYHIYAKAKRLGYVTFSMKENFGNVYAQYHSLGVNGVMDSLKADFDRMQVKSDESETREIT